MLKIIPVKSNPQWSLNDNHTVGFTSLELRDKYIKKYFYEDENFDYLSLLEKNNKWTPTLIDNDIFEITVEKNSFKDIFVDDFESLTRINYYIVKDKEGIKFYFVTSLTFNNSESFTIVLERDWKIEITTLEYKTKSFQITNKFVDRLIKKENGLFYNDFENENNFNNGIQETDAEKKVVTSYEIVHDDSQYQQEIGATKYSKFLANQKWMLFYATEPINTNANPNVPKIHTIKSIKDYQTAMPYKIYIAPLVASTLPIFTIVIDYKNESGAWVETYRKSFTTKKFSLNPDRNLVQGKIIRFRIIDSNFRSWTSVPTQNTNTYSQGPFWTCKYENTYNSVELNNVSQAINFNDKNNNIVNEFFTYGCNGWEFVFNFEIYRTNIEDELQNIEFKLGNDIYKWDAKKTYQFLYNKQNLTTIKIVDGNIINLFTKFLNDKNLSQIIPSNITENDLVVNGQTLQIIPRNIEINTYGFWNCYVEKNINSGTENLDFLVSIDSADFSQLKLLNAFTVPEKLFNEFTIPDKSIVDQDYNVDMETVMLNPEYKVIRMTTGNGQDFDISYYQLKNEIFKLVKEFSFSTTFESNNFKVKSGRFSNQISEIISQYLENKISYEVPTVTTNGQDLERQKKAAQQIGVLTAATRQAQAGLSPRKHLKAGLSNTVLLQGINIRSDNMKIRNQAKPVSPEVINDLFINDFSRPKLVVLDLELYDKDKLLSDYIRHGIQVDSTITLERWDSRFWHDYYIISEVSFDLNINLQDSQYEKVDNIFSKGIHIWWYREGKDWSVNNYSKNNIEVSIYDTLPEVKK